MRDAAVGDGLLHGVLEVTRPEAVTARLPYRFALTRNSQVFELALPDLVPKSAATEGMVHVASGPFLSGGYVRGRADKKLETIERKLNKLDKDESDGKER